MGITTLEYKTKYLYKKKSHQPIPPKIQNGSSYSNKQTRPRI